MTQRQALLRPDWMPRLAAIDIGTNSVRLIIAESTGDGAYRILDDEKDSTRLGKNLASTGRLDPEAVEQTIGALRRKLQIAEGYQVSKLKAIATCAVREAEDGPEFCRRVRDELGLEIEVINARQEADFAFAGVARSFKLEGKNVAVVDIGGGSTEIILASNNIIEEVYTTPLGAVRMTERYGGAQALDGANFKKLVRSIGRQVRKEVGPPLFVPYVLIGSGGTFTTLATIVMAMKRTLNLPVQAYEVSRADLRGVLNRLRKMPSKARCNVTGLSADRADIIVAGLVVIDRIMQHLKVNVIQTHTGGVRDGLLLSMLTSDDSPQTEPATLDADQAVVGFALRCGTDIPHGEQVARLAGKIYEQLVEPFQLPPGDKRLLEVAAILQDVGYLINYDKHHKHSYHLILNSRLPGFKARELELIANVARYHRGARPKMKHESYRKLSTADRARVGAMASILRIASGLDRSHTQQVRDVGVSVNSHKVRLDIVAGDLPEVDLWGAQQRAELFERVFEKKLEIQQVAQAETS